MPNLNSPSERGPDRRHASRRGEPDSVDRLLDGAQATFAERGYHAANVHEICARSNVGIGTFYAHFDHKRELLKRVFVERVLRVGVPTVDDLIDHARLIARIEGAADEPMVAGLLRAWYEAIPDEPDLAHFQAEWQPSFLIELAATIGEARGRSPSKHPRLDPAVIAWTMTTLSRELAIHDRPGAPNLDTLAHLFEQLMFGTTRS
jgi:AcrR family transcriptional regulator